MTNKQTKELKIIAGWEEEIPEIVGEEESIQECIEGFIDDLLMKQAEYSYQQGRKETIKKCIKLVQTHTEKNGEYCDTGGDMDWYCRSECNHMAVKRLSNLLNQPNNEK